MCFSHTEGKASHQGKYDNSLYGETHFIAVVWNGTHNITEVCLRGELDAYKTDGGAGSRLGPTEDTQMVSQLLTPSSYHLSHTQYQGATTLIASSASTRLAPATGNLTFILP